MAQNTTATAVDADEYDGEFEIAYSGQKNVVCRCPDCGTETGERVTPGTVIGPSRSVQAHCGECSTYKQHRPVREAERGEYDSDFICGGCDTMYTNTMDADLCCDDDSPSACADAATDA